MQLFFSDAFAVDPALVESHGAFDISVVSDLPLFIDPFLLFNSSKAEYQRLHSDIIRYLIFLRDQAAQPLDEGLIDSWYRFKEVRQTWLGFTQFGNAGAGLGGQFARALHSALSGSLANFGNETVSRGTHLEKLALIKAGVGQDNISDFTTNLIKGWLCTYTEAFTLKHIDLAHRDEVRVPRAVFNYATQTWMEATYTLPVLRDDFVLLTPADMLTRGQTWINHGDMVRRIDRLPAAVADAEQRAKINNYLSRRLGPRPSAADRTAAAEAALAAFPDLIDVYIRLKEDEGDRAQALSHDRVRDTHAEFVEVARSAIDALHRKTTFFSRPWGTYEECIARVGLFRHWVEHQDGYKLFNRPGVKLATEKDLQLAFGLVWGATDLDVNREVNNGRGPVDFKASFGAADTALIEFKLAKNTALKRNLIKQTAIYETANRTRSSVKVIVCFTAQDQKRVTRILRELGLTSEQSIVTIDCRRDNKPSASKA